MSVCIVYVCAYECAPLSSALSPTGFSAACIELCWEVGKHFSLLTQGDVSEGERAVQRLQGRPQTRQMLPVVSAQHQILSQPAPPTLTPTTTNVST